MIADNSIMRTVLRLDQKTSIENKSLQHKMMTGNTIDKYLIFETVNTIFFSSRVHSKRRKCLWHANV